MPPGRYPALKADFSDADTTATWQEFGHQVREALGLTVTLSSDKTQATLRWQAPSVPPQWNSPTVAYELYRNGDRHPAR